MPDVLPEGQVYQILRDDAEVSHIPRCLASGDFVPYRHYRLSLDTVGRPIVEYSSSNEVPEKKFFNTSHSQSVVESNSSTTTY